MSGPNCFRAERQLAETGTFENDSNLKPLLIAILINLIGMPILYIALKLFFNGSL
jgi:hypothetical protein